MNQEIIEVLKEIKSKEHLELLLPQKISKFLKNIGKSLYEICQFTEDEFVKIDGLGGTKFKYLSEFIEQIDANPILIISFKKHVVDTPIVLPIKFDTNNSLASNIFQAITNLAEILKERVELPTVFFGKVEHNSYNNLYQYIIHYFGLNNSEVLDLIEIGNKLNVKSETIRINLFDYKNRPDLIDLFLHNEIGFGIKINELLIVESKKLIENYLYSSKFIQNFVFNDDELSEVQLKRLVEVFDCTLETINFEDSDYAFQTILRKDEVLEFKAHFKVLNSILRNGLKLTKEALINEMIIAISNLPNQHTNTKIKVNGLNEKMFNVILDEYFKLEIVEEDDKLLYQFKWQYLSSQTDKSTRILFENDRVMSKEEIFEEFQKRENELGIEQSIESIDFLNIRATDKIHPIGKTGNWFYEENYSKEKNSLAQKVNKDIVTKFNGKVYLNQFMEYTISKDFYKNYEVSSIRANVLLCSKQAVNDSNLFIHNDFKEIYPDIELKGNRNKYLGNSIIKIIANIFDVDDSPREKSVLIDLLITKLSDEDILLKTKTNIYQYLLKFSDLGVLTKFEKENTVYFQLDKKELSNYDIDKLGKKQEPEYKKLIRAKAITYLKNHPKVKLSEVFELVKEIAPAENAKTNIYKIFNDTSLFIKETIDKEIWISLDTPKLPMPQEMHVEVSEESTELLGNTILSERARYDLIKLKSEIVNELFSENNTYKMSREVLSNSFDIFHKALTDQNGTIYKWGDSLLQSLYELLCTKTDYYDRETCLNKLITGYETYLKCFITHSQNKLFTGQADVINYFNPISDLRTYKDMDRYNRTDIQKTNFSYILSRIKYLSDVSRHDKTHDSLDMGFNKQIKNAIDFIALYLFSGYVIKSHN